MKNIKSIAAILASIGLVRFGLPFLERRQLISDVNDLQGDLL